MAEHTPGPWSTIGKWVYDVENPSPIAQCLRPYEEGDANARLIAAAPDLLDVAEMVEAIMPAVCQACSDGDATSAHSRICKATCTAIAKAKGGD